MQDRSWARVMSAWRKMETMSSVPLVLGEPGAPGELGSRVGSASWAWRQMAGSVMVEVELSGLRRTRVMDWVRPRATFPRLAVMWRALRVSRGIRRALRVGVGGGGRRWSGWGCRRRG